MKRKGINLLIGLSSIFCVLIPSFGALVLNGDQGESTTISPNDSICRVDFYDGSSLSDTIYVKNGEIVSLKDAPFTFKNNSVYTWKSGNTYINNHPQVNGYMRFDAEPVGSHTQSLMETYWDEYGNTRPQLQNSAANINTNLNCYSTQDPNFAGNNNSSTYYYAGLENYFELSSDCFWIQCGSGSTTFNVKVDKSSSNPSDLPSFPNENMYDNSDPYGVAYRNGTWDIGKDSGGDFVAYTRGNGSIGLETFSSDYYPGKEKYNKYYKPVNYSDFSNGRSPFKTATQFVGQTNVNGENKDSIPAEYMSEYCANRITLNCDVVLTQKLTLGGVNGFLKTDNDNRPLNWTQTEYQGIMIGAYSEIDLNGYDLILENNSLLDSYGSITDSSDSRSGTIVMRNGSTLYSPFEFDDMWRENSIPEIYANSMDFMQMFRCPYLDCSIYFEYGSKFYGKFYVSFGATQGTCHFDLGIVGPMPESGPNLDSAEGFFVLQMEPTEGVIKRITTYNLDLYDDINGSYSDPSLYNISYQKINYVFDNVNVHVCGFRFDVTLHIDLKVVKLDLSISISSKKYQKWIPPFFNFYSYGSHITLYQEYVFMPGCYLYADSSSTISFKNSTFSVDKFVSATISFMEYANKQYSYCAGGISLAQTYYPYSVGAGTSGGKDWPLSSSNKGWFDTRKDYGSGNAGNGSFVWRWTKFWDYYSKIPAKFDCDAALEFDETTNCIPYVLSGNINFPDNGTFIEQVKNKNYIRLYSSCAMSGPSTAMLMCDLHQLNIMGFYSSPLISNGLVLTPMGGSYDGKYYYDNDRGLVININNYSDKYAFILNEPNSQSNHVYYSFNQSLTSSDNSNSLSGSFKKVSYDDNTHVLSDSGRGMIFFQGAFVPFNESSNEGSILKFTAHDALEVKYDTGSILVWEKYEYRTYAYRRFTFNSGKWAISSTIDKYVLDGNSNWNWELT